MLTYQVSVTIPIVSFESFVLIPDLMKKFRPRVSITSGVIINSSDELFEVCSFLAMYLHKVG